ncbi:hypothetical protein GCM10020220_069550 [Nonomuraea rubra]
MRRLLPSAAAVAALVLTVSACGGGGGETAAPPAQVSDPSKVSGEVTWWDTTRPDSEGPTFQALIKEFQAKYPQVKVNYVNVPSDQAQNQFQTAAQAGTGAPDVIRSEVAWTSQFASLGYLQPLDGTRAVDQPDDFLPGPLSSTKFNGKTYAVPQVTDTLALIYNKRLLKEAGHEEPPKTIAELKQTALDVKAKTGAAGLALNVDSYFLLPFMYGEGGDLLDVANKKIVVNSPANVKAMETVADLISSGAAPKPATTESYANAMTALKEGKAAMIYNGPWALSEIYQGKEFQDKENLGIAPVPAGSVKAAAPHGRLEPGHLRRLQEHPGRLRVRPVHDHGRGAGQDRQGDQPAAHPHLRLQQPRRAGQRGRRGVQADHGHRGAAPLDPRGRAALPAAAGGLPVAGRRQVGARGHAQGGRRAVPRDHEGLELTGDGLHP